MNRGLHEVLKEMKASEALVTEVQTAEATTGIQNRLIAFAPMTNLLTSPIQPPTMYSLLAEYSLRNGGEVITFETPHAVFEFQVSEAGHGSVWIYRNHSGAFYKAPGRGSGVEMDIKDLRREVDPIAVARGQSVIVRDDRGGTLVARLIRANHPKNDERFGPAFVFNVYGRDRALFMP